MKIRYFILYFSDRSKEYEVDIPDLERVAWIWCLLFAFVVPELGSWFRSTRICVFKSWERPPVVDFAITFMFETLHTAGLALLFFTVLPELDVVKAAMLTNCVCFVPALFGQYSAYHQSH
jgi:chitin synthase